MNWTELERCNKVCWNCDEKIYFMKITKSWCGPKKVVRAVTRTEKVTILGLFSLPNICISQRLPIPKIALSVATRAT